MQLLPSHHTRLRLDPCRRFRSVWPKCLAGGLIRCHVTGALSTTNVGRRQEMVLLA